MTGLESPHALAVMLVGVTIVASALVRIALARTRVPTMVGFLVLGLLLRGLDDGLGPEVMPAQACAAMVVTVLGTCLVTPWPLNTRLRAPGAGRLVTA